MRPSLKYTGVTTKNVTTNSEIYGTLSDTLEAICCCASCRPILLNRLGLGINFIQWIPLTSYNDTQFVAVDYLS